jgi:cytochrome P450
VTQTASPYEQAAAPHRDGGLPEASLSESLKFVTLGLLPTLARGLFSARPQMVKLAGELKVDERATKAITEIRRAHPGQGARLLGGRLVLLWGSDAIREVLDRSADVYASDAGAKGKGMCHFQPDALTLSRGEEWRDRRAFNESVLATSESLHPDADRFVAVVADEVARTHMGDGLTWSDWEELFDHITLRVIFGDRARDEQELTQLLDELMGEANRLVGLSEGDGYFEFYGRLERQLQDPEPGSLVARFADAPQTDRTRVVHQLPHWIFAMRNTLGANTWRALAMIVADDDIEQRAIEEIEAADLSRSSDVDGLKYLEGCLSEAMRLWPTTPILARETTRETTLAGQRLEKGTQVMIFNTFNHRDPEQVEDAHDFRPERWSGGERDYRFNHLSNGTQDCPGGPLVYLLGKAVLANVIGRYDLTLRKPSLDPSQPLPLTLDPFETSFATQPRA